MYAHLINKKIIYTAFGMVVLQGANFFATLIIASNIGAIGLGRFQLLVAFVGAVVLISKLGIDEALAYVLPRQSSGDKTRSRAIISYALLFSISVSIFIGFVIFIFSGLLTNVLFNSLLDETDLIFAIILIGIQLFLLVCLGGLRGLEKTDQRAIAYYFIVGPIFLLLIFLGSKFDIILEEVYYAKVLSVAIGAIVAVVFLLRATTGQSLFFKRTEVNELHAFANWMVFVGVFQYMIQQPFIDLIVVSHFDSPENVGLYSIAAKFAGLVLQIQAAYIIVVAPSFAKIVRQKNDIELNRAYLLNSEFVAHITVVISMFLFLFVEDALRLVGQEFVGAKNLFYVLATGFLISGLLGVSAPLLLSKGYKKTEFKFTLFSVFLLISSSIALGYYYKSIGVALGTSISISFLAVLRVLYIRKNIFKPRLIYLRRVLGASLISLSCALLASLVIDKSGLVNKLAVFAIFILIYTYTLCRMGLFGNKKNAA